MLSNEDLVLISEALYDLSEARKSRARSHLGGAVHDDLIADAARCEELADWAYRLRRIFLGNPAPIYSD